MAEPVAATDKSKKINAINKEVVHQICSGQVVLDLATAIKELVENSLDSGANIIDVKLTDYGKTCISVSDNGSGVVEEDFEGLGLKHHTSKLREFSDLTEVNTFGFRGEALSSLCALSELSLITKHNSCEHGYKLKFDKNGKLEEKEACARERGTTVHVRNIFKSLPVRFKEFERNLKKEYAKAVQILYSYCLVSIDKKITCTNLISGKSTSLIVSTANCSNILNNIAAVFGKKAVSGLNKLELLSPDENTLQEYNLPNNPTIDFDWDCYISGCDHDVGRSTPDRQFFYVNGRPCDLMKVSKLVNQIYHRYNNKQYPFVFLNLKLDKSSTDINVTPDKRTIFCTQEKLILATLKYNLIVKWENLQGSFTTKTLFELNFGAKRPISPNNESPPAKRLQNFKLASDKHKINQKECIPDIKVEEDPGDEDDSCETVLSVVEVPLNMSLVKEKFELRIKSCTPKIMEGKRVKYKSVIQANQTEAEKELRRELTKDSFTKMEVIGQFNLGFIIARLEDDLFIIDQHATDEKFRFEKLNNETQIKTQKLIAPKALNLSTLNEAILIERPEIFENNGYTFKFNHEGMCNDVPNVCMCFNNISHINLIANAGERVELTGIPVSGNWQFGQEDIEELIFLIREGDAETKENKNVIRPSRVRQMLASRACRSAVMIGTALNVAEMRKLILQMSLMQNPWNCPHGRPTIRHLLCLFLTQK